MRIGLVPVFASVFPPQPVTASRPAPYNVHVQLWSYPSVTTNFLKPMMRNSRKQVLAVAVRELIGVDLGSQNPADLQSRMLRPAIIASLRVELA